MGKGSKSLASRGPCALPRNRGTGFEEFFADPPMKPEEADEEKLEIYAECVPFEERIQSCIQRFRSRRRLQGDQTLYFNEYLFLGGIDTSPNSFSGLDQKDLQDLTPAERRDATATDAVHTDSSANQIFYNGNKEHWCVDFTGVAAGFLSTSLGPLTGFEPKKVDEAIGVVEHFLRYVLQHDVCPEYKVDVEKALAVCQQARKEWPMVNQFSDDLPGLFNLAASEMFSTFENSDWSLLTWKRPEGYDAKLIFLASCALCCEPKIMDYFHERKLYISGSFSCTARVCKIERPSGDDVEMFSALSVQSFKHTIEPLGKLFFKKTTNIEDEWEQPEIPYPFKETQLWVFMEDRLLVNILPGMRMEMTIVELTSGLRFIKTISKIVPTFYTFLPQRMMRHFKPPRENDRPAPSVQDFASVEAQVACME